MYSAGRQTLNNRGDYKIKKAYCNILLKRPKTVSFLLYPGLGLDYIRTFCYRSKQTNKFSYNRGSKNMDTFKDSENLNTDGTIKQDYYKNVINELIDQIIIEWDIDRDKLNINRFNGIFNEIGKRLFYTETQTKIHNKKCNIPYNEYNLTTLFNIYKDICYRFNIPMSVYSFGLLTHIEDGTIKKYVTSIDSDILNNRREFVRGRLFDNNLGITVLANNDTSVGLMYNRQNTIEKTMITQSLSFSDLKPIEQKTD